jgi:hypothetical protein
LQLRHLVDGAALGAIQVREFLARRRQVGLDAEREFNRSDGARGLVRVAIDQPSR